MSRRLWGPALIGLLMLGMNAMPAFAQPVSPSSGTSGARQYAALAPTQFASQVLARINVRRKHLGCRALRANSALTLSARRHTSLMVQRDDLSHQLQGESGLVPRIVAAGYNPWRALAENLAWGPPSPSTIYSMWMHSAPHRANMQNCRLRDAGVGVVYGGGYAWVTLDLGRH